MKESKIEWLKWGKETRMEWKSKSKENWKQSEMKCGYKSRYQTCCWDEVDADLVDHQKHLILAQQHEKHMKLNMGESSENVCLRHK